MKVTPITSPNNALLKQIRGLHQRSLREKSGLFLIEGPKAIGEAFDKNVRVRDLVVSETFWKEEAAVIADRDVPTISVVADKLLKELATTTTPSGIIATAEVPHHELDELFSGQPPLVVIVHAIQDPGNLGTLFRTALAASASGVILTHGTVDAYNPKVVRAAMGALFGMPVITDMPFEKACDTVRQRGLRVIGCEPTATLSLFDTDLTGPVAIVLGNEGQGFTAADLEHVDEQIAIPMNPKSESLNVAISGAVVLFNVVQQRLKSKSI
jgi:TrmH family RNA methyltransferase